MKSYVMNYCVSSILYSISFLPQFLLISNTKRIRQPNLVMLNQILQFAVELTLTSYILYNPS